MVLVHDLLSYCNNCMKFYFNSFNGCQLTERTRNSIANDQREITPKISKAEFWFLCMTHCLIVLYNCMKFHFNSFNGCQLTEQTRNSIANDLREMTPKISKAELWFLCMTHCLIVLYNCMKFDLNIMKTHRKKLDMDSADPQNRSEWRGRLRGRLVKKPNPL